MSEREPAAEPTARVEVVSVRHGPLRPCKENENIDGAPQFAYDILPPTRVQVFSRTHARLVDAEATAVSGDGKLVFVEYHVDTNYHRRWMSIENVQPPLSFSSRSAAATPTAEMATTITRDDLGLHPNAPPNALTVSGPTAAPKRGRFGCTTVILVTIGGLAAALAAGCRGKEPAEDPRIQEARHLQGHRPRMQEYGISMDPAARRFSIRPESKMSTVRREIRLPPGASMPVIDEIADPDGNPGDRLLRVQYEAEGHKHTFTVSRKRAFVSSREPLPQVPASASTKR